jgi:hypothetical protein
LYLHITIEFIEYFRGTHDAFKAEGFPLAEPA